MRPIRSSVKLETPIGFDVPVISGAFNVMSDRIAAVVRRKGYGEVYGQYANRVTAIADTLMRCEGVAPKRKQSLAALILAGTAVDYAGKDRRATMRAFMKAGLYKPADFIRLYDWALERKPLENLKTDQILVTSCWLISDSEKALELSALPERLKAMMKRVHAKNCENGLGADIPRSVKARLEPALTRILVI